MTARRRGPAFAVFGATLALAVGMAADLGIVWDEPFFWRKEDRLGEWAGLLAGTAPQRAYALSAKGRAEYFPYCIRTPDENPPVYAEAGWLGWRLTHHWLGELRGRRFASCVFFAAVAAGVFHLARRWGRSAAATAWGAWVLNPRIFAEGRFGCIDMTMAGLWFLGAWAFFRAAETGRGRWLPGPLLGLAMMSKFTAVLALPAQMLWCVWQRRPLVKTWLWLAALMPLAMVAVHPAWWDDPERGFRTAIEVHRGRHLTQRVPTYYLGQVYDHSLPWHNTLVLAAACVPPCWVALAAAGIAACLWRRGRDALVAWALCHWLALMLMRATPLAPGHDGLRQLLACFPFFAVLAGFGAGALARRAPRLAGWGVGLALLAGAQSCLRSRPHELSYYSEAVGGLPGARKLGLETTYWWDAADRSLLAWLNATPAPAARIGVSSRFLRVFEEWQRLGELRPDLMFVSAEKFPRPPQGFPPGADWMIVLRREGWHDDLEPTLAAFERWFEGPVDFAVTHEGVRLLVVRRAAP